MAKARIKEDYKSTVIGFNNSALPLGERDDIDVLAILAQQSGDPSLLKLFEEDTPSADQLLKDRVDTEIKARKERNKAKAKASEKKADE